MADARPARILLCCHPRKATFGRSRSKVPAIIAPCFSDVNQSKDRAATGFFGNIRGRGDMRIFQDPTSS